MKTLQGSAVAIDIIPSAVLGHCVSIYRANQNPRHYHGLKLSQLHRLILLVGKIQCEGGIRVDSHWGANGTLYMLWS